MRKQIIFFFILLNLVFVKVNANSSFSLPETFNVSQRWISLTLTFDIETTNGIKLGTVHRKFFSLHTEYDLYDFAEQLKAKAKLRLLTLYPIFDVVDEFDNEIGRVEGYVLTILPTFDIVAKDGTVVALAKMNFWGTKFTLMDPKTKEEFAVLSRAYIRLKDNWTVEITRPDLYHQKAIDPRLFVTMMAFQTDYDSWSHNSSVNTKAKQDNLLSQISERDCQYAADVIESIYQDLSLSYQDVEESLLLSLISEKVSDFIKNNELTSSEQTALKEMIHYKILATQ